jgi:oligopeptide/dipeptide ABC transporter ATP-binding protein
MDTDEVLAVRDLHTEIDSPHGLVRAVDGVSFSLRKGRTLAVVGESGCGKTMTALSIVGLLRHSNARTTSGEVLFGGRNLLTLDRRELEDIRGRDIAMIFQDPMTSLNPVKTVGDQITETLRRHSKLGRREARARSVELLAEVGIARPAERSGAFPHEFSGGMRQRVMIAIAISCNPQILIADEPTTALDVTVQARILNLLHRLREQHGMGLMLITHDMGIVADVADEALVMYAGQVVEQAGVYELFDHPEHPYTSALLAASPSLAGGEARGDRLAAIGGMPPSLIHPPSGCRFAPRCPYAQHPDGCADGPVPLAELRPGHLVRTRHPASLLTAEGAR